MDRPPDAVNLEFEQKGDITVFHIAGKLDANAAPKVEKTLFDEIDSGKNKLLLDLHGVDYMSSAGMRVLLQTSRRVEASEGKMVLSSLSKKLLEILAISGLDRYFDIADNEGDAIKKIQE